MDVTFSKELIERLTTAEKIVFFTGAGISAESGISTFRGAGGIWNKLKPEELASFDAFLKNPKMVWEWYQYRRSIINESKPNAGHLAIAETQKYYKRVSVVTQNVDNLHIRAGSKNVLELHGNIERNYCIECKTFDNTPDLILNDEPPRCKICEELIRPDIVWFGEMLPQGVFEESELQAEQCDICFVVGTSAVVYPAAYIPATAKKAGAYLVEINVEQTELSSYADYSIIGESGKTLPKILEEIKKVRETNNQ